ncbi:hypothetical protein LCGC14_1031780 [marine sediment metagenome]|uniref:Uncharacterized protein n=1 Tax=marine sediment metagenome TaxID=412755 RepID=A0A0F9R0A9_9ZZZZ
MSEELKPCMNDMCPRFNNKDYGCNCNMVEAYSILPLHKISKAMEKFF